MRVSLKKKLFVRIRNIIFPFEKIEKYIPKKGNILDIGCGQGYFSTLLSRLSSKRNVLGIDPSASKIKEAKILSKKYPNIHFKNCLLHQIKNGGFDAVSIIDVLYLLPLGEKINLLKQVRRLLKDEGTLILKETKRNWFIALEEFFMIKSNLTYSKYQNTFFQDKNELIKLLKNTGFEVRKFEEIKRLFYKHLIFIVQKNLFN